MRETQDPRCQECGHPMRDHDTKAGAKAGSGICLAKSTDFVGDGYVTEACVCTEFRAPTSQETKPDGR